jgi:hypothetical protein
LKMRFFGRAPLTAMPVSAGVEAALKVSLPTEPQDPFAFNESMVLSERRDGLLRGMTIGRGVHRGGWVSQSCTIESGITAASGAPDCAFPQPASAALTNAEIVVERNVRLRAEQGMRRATRRDGVGCERRIVTACKRGAKPSQDYSGC